MKLTGLIISGCIAAMVGVGMASHHLEEEKKPIELNIGDQAPAFEAKDDMGKAWKSEDHVGKKTLVVYFYPAAMTRGCTAQACAFRDDKAALDELGVEVVGISGDSAEGQAYFKQAHELNFTLLADSGGKIAEKFGVPVRKGGSLSRMIGEEEVTLVRDVSARRWTFIIGTDGKILHKETQVKAAMDSQNVVAFVKSITEESVVSD